jgi:hypothetical protein
MAPAPVFATVARVPQSNADSGESMIESVPADGEIVRQLSAAEENAVLIIALPVILLVVGAILHMARRPPAGSNEPGHPGGVVLMAIGGALTFAILAYLLMIQ